jgi:SAM-dependent methyltransferase
MYEKIVQYYDLIHQDLSEDIAYIIKLIAQYEQPVLELGCGTGRLLLPISRTGHSVVGLDISAAMLAEARVKILKERASVQKRIELLHVDMSKFSLEQQFGLIVLPHNTLMHLDRSQLKTTLSSIKEHLVAGGCLFIDVDNPLEVGDPGDNDLVILERTLHNEEARTTTLQFSSSHVETRRQIRRVTWIFDESPREGGGVKRTVVKTVLHYYLAHELALLIEESGLKVQAQYGSYSQEPYGEDSPRLLIEATIG